MKINKNCNDDDYVYDAQSQEPIMRMDDVARCEALLKTIQAAYKVLPDGWTKTQDAAKNNKNTLPPFVQVGRIPIDTLCMAFWHKQPHNIRMILLRNSSRRRRRRISVE